MFFPALVLLALTAAAATSEAQRHLPAFVTVALGCGYLTLVATGQ